MKAYKALDWEDLVKEWQASGKSKTAFCRERKISLSSFYKWLNSNGNKGFHQVQVISPNSNSTNIASSAFELSSKAKFFKIKLSEGIELSFPIDSNPKLVKAQLLELKEI